METLGDRQFEYPDKTTVRIEGQEVEIYNTNNFFGNLVLRQKQQTVGIEDSLTATAQFGMLYKNRLLGYLDTVLKAPDDASHQVADMARQGAALTPYGHEDERQAYNRWFARTEEPEFKLQVSQTFEQVALGMEKDGLNPVDITL